MKILKKGPKLGKKPFFGPFLHVFGYIDNLDFLAILNIYLEVGGSANPPSVGRGEDMITVKEAAIKEHGI